MTIAEAILKLRHACGESRQVFATHLQLGQRTLQYYEESARLPPVKTLLWLAAKADDIGSDDLFPRFLGQEFLDQLTMPPGWELNISFRRTAPPTVVEPGTVGILTQKMERKITKRKL